MKDDARSQLPLNDANGNAGTHPPQREVYYEACQATEQKNREWNAERSKSKKRLKRLLIRNA